MENTVRRLPKDMEMARQMVRKRHLPPEKEKERLQEMDEHYNRYINDENLRNQFDYVIYNNYDLESTNELLELIRKMKGEKN